MDASLLDPAPGRGVVLIGFRGTGKTTVGRLVAERLGRLFLDADRECEAVSGRSIGEIFALDGENAFRDLEEKALLGLVRSQENAVLATGGGAVLRKTNVERLRAFGRVIWLTAPAEVLSERLMLDPVRRPALTDMDSLNEIMTLLAIREPLYRQAAHASVSTEGVTPSIVANRVVSLVSRQGDS